MDNLARSLMEENGKVYLSPEECVREPFLKESDLDIY